VKKVEKNISFLQKKSGGDSRIASLVQREVDFAKQKTEGLFSKKRALFSKSSF
jgi:hypothetical protein